MNSQEELIEHLKNLPEDERQKLIDATVDKFSKIKFIPNPGPQSDAYYSKADVLLYGGSAGSGKSALITGLALTQHKKSHIFRRKYADLGALAEDLCSMYGSRKGFSQMPRPKLRTDDDRLIEFGACQHAGDEEAWQGQAADLKCVAAGTKVLMSDFTYRNIEHVKVGDLVHTLEGPRRVNRAFKSVAKECVRASILDGDGGVMFSQVQSASHSVLSTSGWVSHDTFSSSHLASSSSPTISHDDHICAEQCEETFPPRRRPPLNRTYRRQTSPTPKQSLLDRLYSLGTSLLGARSGEGTCFLSSGGVPQVRAQHLSLSRTPQEPFLTCFHRFLTSFFQHPIWRGNLNGRARSSLLNCQGGYSNGCDLYGARVLQCDGSYSGGAVFQACLLQQAYAGTPTPNNFVACGRDDIHKCNLEGLNRYPHPYTKDIRYTSEEVCVSALQLTPVENVDLYDIEVDDVNHYITLGGFVNKNCFDEITQFLEKQFRYIITWNRLPSGASRDQRARVVCASNPPTSSDGDWVIPFWGPWLDPTHPNPAKPGELRWCVADPDGKDFWVDGPEPYLFPGTTKTVEPKSRTFIPGRLQDNPYLINTDYAATLDALPEPLRSAMRDGNFMLTRSDDENQVIPSDWIRQAQARWKPEPPEDVPMSCIAADCAQGGPDDNVIGWRHDWWFSKQIVIPGKDTPLGTDIAGPIITRRLNGANVVIDVGGGYGAATYKTLKDNEIRCVGYNGSKATKERARGSKLEFANHRARDWWRFREALDPSQPGGSKIAIPPCARLAADLGAPTFKAESRGIIIEKKEAIKKRLGRSPDKGDQIVMCWSAGDKGTAVGAMYGTISSKHGGPGLGRGRFPQVNLGYKNRRR